MERLSKPSCLGVAIEQVKATKPDISSTAPDANNQVAHVPSRALEHPTLDVILAGRPSVHKVLHQPSFPNRIMATCQTFTCQL